MFNLHSYFSNTYFILTWFISNKANIFLVHELSSIILLISLLLMKFTHILCIILVQKLIRLQGAFFFQFGKNFVTKTSIKLNLYSHEFTKISNYFEMMILKKFKKNYLINSCLRKRGRKRNSRIIHKLKWTQMKHFPTLWNTVYQWML